MTGRLVLALGLAALALSAPLVGLGVAGVVAVRCLAWLAAAVAEALGGEL